MTEEQAKRWEKPEERAATAAPLWFPFGIG